MLNWFRRWRPSLLERLEYWIIEPSPERRAWQQKSLEEFAGLVRWWDSLESIPSPVTGVLFSNELFDAMPVQRFAWDAGGRRWFEWRVAVEAEQFVWARGEIGAAEVETQFSEGGIELSAEVLAVLPDGLTIDLSAEAGCWWRSAAERLEAGRLMTIDYGLAADQFIAPERSRGTLRAYSHHHVSDDFLLNPGEQDLTAHINFTQLRRAGETAGLRTEGLFSQAQFLTEIARCAWEPDSGFGEWARARVRQFQTLTHPDHLGRAFRVLVQSR
jgi:SAM-dependent MidA family methyltransferase